MQAVILAAGMATRLKPLTDKTPKCLLELSPKRPILDYMLTGLIAQGLTRLVMVTGFEAGQIESFIKSRFPALETVFVHNPDFETTNNAYSLLLAQHEVKGGFILLDSDIVFDPRIIGALKNEKGRPVLAVNCHPCGDEEIKVRVNENFQIQEISKKVDPAKTMGESIGIELFCEKSARILFETLEKRMIKENRINEFYEASFEEMIVQGHDFYACDVTEFPAMEIDFAEDLEKARILVETL